MAESIRVFCFLFFRQNEIYVGIFFFLMIIASEDNKVAVGEIERAH